MEKKRKAVPPSVSAAESILAAVGMRTNTHTGRPYNASHGGQQMRVVHTARGTYAAFVTDFGYESHTAKFYVAKIGPDGRAVILYGGEYLADHSTPLVNIGQDTDGDVVVTVCGPETLSAYFFDRYTDAVTEYAAKPGFSCDAGFSKYTQVMFDFARRRLYAFCASGLGSGDFLLSWFAFDMEAKTWSVPALYKRIEGIRRHCYLFPFPDGNGGAYIVAERDDVVDLEPKLRDTGENKYLWDELRLFHIPDLTSPENVTYTTIHAAFSERADEGIWSCITNNQSGSVFMDADGYLHVTYLYSLYDLSGRQPDLDPDRQYRHAVYRGMECVFNDRIPFAGEGDTGCKPFVTQGTDGTLYMILFILDRDGTRIGIWRARDALGRTWIREKTLPLRDGIRAGSSCISAVRDGSTQDGTVSCFFYGKSRAGGGGGNTVYTFTLSLEDYSMTPAVDVLGEYDLCVDHRLDRRAFSSAHTTKIVRTEHGAYAAFTYDHAVGDLTYSYDGQREDFCIVRLGEDGAKVLFTGSYVSRQDRYLTMRRTPDGMIAVCPPDGFREYVVDPACGTVTERFAGETDGTLVQQIDLLAGDGGGCALYAMNTNPFTLTGYRLRADGMPEEAPRRTFVFDRPIPDVYTRLYVLADGRGGAYLVGTRIVGRPVVTDYRIEKDEGGVEYLTVRRETKFTSPMPAALTYRGRTDEIADSLMLFYIPDAADGTAVRCAEIEPPYEAEGGRGIWSVVDAADCGDAYLDADGRLHVFYTAYHFDFNDTERRADPALITKTLKHIHAVYDGTALVSSGELGIEGLTKEAAVRMAQTADGRMYLLVCNIGEDGARIDVYSEDGVGWTLAASRPIGDFTAESFSVSGPRGGSVEDGTVDCLVYGTDNDVYHVTVTLAE